MAQILIHLVCSTKKRVPFFSEAIRPGMHLYLTGILKNLGCTVYEINGADNHVHILCEIAISCFLTDIISKLKASSSN